MTRIDECIDSFFFHCTYEKNLSPKTLKAYQIDLKQFTSFTSNKTTEDEIQNIDKSILRMYLKTLLENNKPKTVKRKIATLKAFFNYIEYEDIIKINPFRKLKIKLKDAKTLPKTIHMSSLIKIFRHLYKTKENYKQKKPYAYKAITRDIAVLELLFSTGIRVAELCNLKKNNITLTKSNIKITGKGNKERIIPICNTETIKALANYQDLFQQEISSSKYFFINRLKSRLSEQSVRQMIKKYTRATKINENITPHMFRHTLATQLLERGVDTRNIQTLLGHSSITTTQIYMQVSKESQRKILRHKHPRNKFCITNNDIQPPPNNG